MVEILRYQRNFSEAITKHMQAIEMLRNLGVKFDLAEAYYQAGVTTRLVGEIEQSHIFFQEALRLFTEMEAPKQVERVRRSMENHTQ